MSASAEPTDERPASRPGTNALINPLRHVAIGAAVLGCSLGGLLFWSAAVPLSSAVIAPGTVVVDSNRKMLQPARSGVVNAIHVRDGDVVEAGELLITLDDEDLRAADYGSRQLLLMAEAKRVRLYAERQNADTISFPELVTGSGLEDAPRIIADQASIFRARRAAFRTRVATLESKRAQAQDAVVGLERQLAQQRERVRLTQREIDDTRTLADKGYAPQRRLLELGRAMAQLEGRTAELELALQDARRAARHQELEIERTQAAYQETVESELQAVEKELFGLRETRRSIRHRRAELELRAPTAGTVVNLAVHTIGGVVAQGATLMEIVPLDDPLVVDVRINPQDVDYIAVNMAADVHLLGLKRRSRPPVRGRVANVSADLVADPEGRAGFYLGRVELPTDVADAARLFRPGLPVEVVVVRGERTLMSFLLEPLTRTLEHAFKE
jgi:HlyD family type I secretion membrane fusion protein